MNRRLEYPAAALTLAGACFLAFFAYLVRLIDCHEDSQSVCSTGGNVQFLIAIAGLAPAVGMVVLGTRGRGRLGLWFASTLLVYVVWAMWLWLVGETA